MFIEIGILDQGFHYAKMKVSHGGAATEAECGSPTGEAGLLDKVHFRCQAEHGLGRVANRLGRFPNLLNQLLDQGLGSIKRM
jgi:hypothetical protein